MVILTSNSTREMSDALKRRCLHLYIPFPDIDLEQRIVQTRVPNINEKLAHQLSTFIHELRALELKKHPAISETLDWAKTLVLLHAHTLEPKVVRSTLNVILKYQEDIEAVAAQLPVLLAKSSS